jgi:hypothetical protein
MSESASFPVKVTVTLVLFQPFALAAGVGVALAVGAVLSMLIPLTVVLAVLPALSVAAPLADCPAPSVEMVCGAAHDAMPEVASLHVNATVTSCLYQPFAFGADVADPLMVGAVASRLIVTDWEAVPPALVAVHVSVVPVVSDVIVVEPQPDEDEIAESGSVTVQLTVTLLVYQPLFPSVPLTLGVITGGVLSAGAAAMLKLIVMVAGFSLIVVFASNVSTIE